MTDQTPTPATDAELTVMRDDQGAADRAAALADAQQRIPVVGVFEWAHERGIDLETPHKLAVRMLHGALARGSYLFSAPQTMLLPEGETLDIDALFLRGDRVVSTNRIQTAWARTITEAESFSKSLSRDDARVYRRLITDTKLAATHKRGPRNTFFFGFRDPDTDAVVIGMAAYKEPKDRLLGRDIESISPELFERLFLGKGGTLATSDPEKGVRRQAGYAFDVMGSELQTLRAAADSKEGPSPEGPAEEAATTTADAGD